MGQVLDGYTGIENGDDALEFFRLRFGEDTPAFVVDPTASPPYLRYYPDGLGSPKKYCEAVMSDTTISVVGIVPQGDDDSNPYSTS